MKVSRTSLLVTLLVTLGIAIPAFASQITITKQTQKDLDGLPSIYYVGDTIHFIMHVINPAANPATNTIEELHDHLPDGTDYYFISPNAGDNPETTTPLVQAPGDDETYTYDYLVTGAESFVTLPSGNPGLQNTIHAEGFDSLDDLVSAEAQRNVRVIQPSTIVTIVSSAAAVVAGDTVDLTVTEENDGVSTELENVEVVVNDGSSDIATLTAPPDSGDDGDGILQSGETWQWTITGVVVSGPTTYTATGTGDDPLGNPVTIPDFPAEQDEVDVDVLVPCIDIEKATNGYDGDDCVGQPIIPVGDPVTWTYVVTNCGDVPLSNVVVTDDNGTPGDTGDDFNPTFVGGDTNTNGVLDLTEIWEYTAEGVAQAGQYNNEACVTGEPPTGDPVEDCDPSCYNGEEPGDEGCTPGYWKNNARNWEANAWVGYTPGQTFSSVFGVVITVRGQGKTTIDDPTLLEALDANGGGINALARHAVAALLNASSDCVAYPLTVDQVIAAVQDAIAAGEEAIEVQHGIFAGYNEAGCPINQHGECVGVEEEVPN